MDWFESHDLRGCAVPRYDQPGFTCHHEHRCSSLPPVLKAARNVLRRVASRFVWLRSNGRSAGRLLLALALESGLLLAGPFGR